MKSTRDFKKIQKDTEGSIWTSLLAFIFVLIIIGAAYVYVPQFADLINSLLGIEESEPGALNVEWGEINAVDEGIIWDDKDEIQPGDTVDLSEYDYIQFEVIFVATTGYLDFIKNDLDAPTVRLLKDGLLIASEKIDIVGGDSGVFNYIFSIYYIIGNYIGIGGENLLEDKNLNFEGDTVEYQADIWSATNEFLGETEIITITGE